MKKNNEVSKEAFGKRLKKIREEKKLTQEALGRLLGYKNPGSDISNLERGHQYPSIEKLIDLAQTLPISIDYLLLGIKNFNNKSGSEIKNIEKEQESS